METVILIGAAVVGTSLIIAGLWVDARTHREHPVIRPIQPKSTVIRPIQPPLPIPVPEETPALRDARPLARARALAADHPAPLYAWLETAFWLLVLVSAINHLGDKRDSIMARATWLLTIGPHEIGHVICWPFGWTLHILGGSIWQVLWWLLLAVYVLLRYKRITGALFFMAIVGHSFINMSPYIADARARKLPLLFGMDSSHHDWWNLLSRYDLLEYDKTLGTLAAGLGALIVVSMALLGITAAWALPRRLGPSKRYDGSPVRALHDALEGSHEGLDAAGIDHDV